MLTKFLGQGESDSSSHNFVTVVSINELFSSLQVIGIVYLNHIVDLTNPPTLETRVQQSGNLSPRAMPFSYGSSTKLLLLRQMEKKGKHQALLLGLWGRY